MKAHKDFYLVVALGEVVAKHYNFDAALAKAKKLAAKTGDTHTIDAVEQRSVTAVHPSGYVFGREES